MVRVFIAHSSDDDWLLDPICHNLRNIPVEPYRARLEDPTPIPLPQKLDRAIKLSDAMFVFLTSNVMRKSETWDIVNWEIATAYTNKKPVYVWRERDVRVPLMLSYITVWFTYDPMDQQSLDEAVIRANAIASELKNAKDRVGAAVFLAAIFLGMWFLGSRK